ncbi:glycosyltransferase [Romeria aff. gracilis LEGE 07310]|uniref:Glycosyltransferase n=1 Tax=Vasconcelosia minhoensis LEGE 07310 TaxID=915328 RepID=A0A8J7AJH5_9CYAN|nr:glycosyltransferase [Romeria gracilis]MBE9078733.1 glycosyltransferase [Romeria aff. gracilis LEGE 07310]
MDSAQPLFSIIIPTYNRPRQIVACLESLTRLDYPRDRFEVIVVDDGSDEPLDAVVEPFQKVLNLVLLRQANAGPAAARNRAADKAQGRYIAFTDDDCMPARDWLQKLAACFAQKPVCIVGGRTVNALDNNPFSMTSQNIISMGYDHYNAVRDQARFFASNNMVVPKQEFLELGGFDESFTTSEDRELCDRWIHAGYPMTYAPEVVIYHAHPMTLRSFWKQHFNYGRGAFRFHQTRSQKGWGNFEIEGGYYLRLLRYPFTHGQSRQGLTLTAVLFVSQVANAAGFFWERRERQRG